MDGTILVLKDTLIAILWNELITIAIVVFITFIVIIIPITVITIPITVILISAYCYCKYILVFNLNEI
jgi:hypothetical protein